MRQKHFAGLIAVVVLVSVIPAFGVGSVGYLDINNAGQVVGFHDNGYLITPFWSGRARGINDAGQIVGSNDGRAAIWDNGVITYIREAHETTAAAWNINNNGQVVGYVRYGGHSGDYPLHAFIWENGVMTDLGTLGGEESWAFEINDSGQVVGQADPSSSDWDTAFVWENGVMTALPSPPPSCAFDINEAGVIVGRARGDAPGRWEKIGGSWVETILDILPGCGTSWALGINDANQVVGFARPGPAWRAVLWDGGVVTDLNELLPVGSEWELLQACAINDNGQVAGWGAKAGDYERLIAYRMNLSDGSIEAVPPIPEPATMSLLALGGLALIRRRRR